MISDKKITSRINRVIGQLEGIKKMINSEQECPHVLIQFKAANSALESAIKLYSQEKIEVCFKNLDQKQNKKELAKLLESLIK
jgi:DNA-binding FrmR family transcriptional regulator